MNTGLSLSVKIAALDIIVAHLTRIEENMATKSDLEDAFREQSTALGEIRDTLNQAVDNLSGDIDRPSSTNVTDAEIAAARGHVDALSAVRDRAAALAARTPEQPAPPA